MMDFQHLTNHNAEFKDDKMVTDVSTYLDRFQQLQIRELIIGILLTKLYCDNNIVIEIQFWTSKYLFNKVLLRPCYVMNGRKYLQTIYLKRDLHLEYIKKSYNSIINGQFNTILYWAKGLEDMPPKKIHQWPTGTWENAPHTVIRQSCNLHFVPTRMAVIKKPDGN